jgi:hypothetical protein
MNQVNNNTGVGKVARASAPQPQANIGELVANGLAAIAKISNQFTANPSSQSINLAQATSAAANIAT